MFSLLRGYWENWIWIQQGWREKLAFVLLMKSYFGRPVKTKFWVAWHFSGFNPIYLCYLCLLACSFGTLQIYLVISFASVDSQPAISARDTLLLFLAHNKLKHLPRPLSSINRPRPNDQIWPFIGCTGIAQPNRDVDKSHVCEKRRQVRKLILSLSKCEYYS